MKISYAKLEARSSEKQKTIAEEVRKLDVEDKVLNNGAMDVTSLQARMALEKEGLTVKMQDNVIKFFGKYGATLVYMASVSQVCALLVLGSTSFALSSLTVACRLDTVGNFFPHRYP